MRKIYTGIDIGSDSIKIVISEYFNDKFNVLASTCVQSKGVKKGIIVDKDLVINSFKDAIKDIESTIGIRIDEAIVTVPSNEKTLKITSGNTKIVGEDGVITGEDIINCLSDAIVDKVPDNEELVTIIPIAFSVDSIENILDPKGRKGEYLGIKAVMVTIPKKTLFSILEVCSKCEIEVKDVIFGTIGDYYEARGKDTENSIGAIINIGSETTDISIFNKGIIIKNDVITLGSKNIDKDISYMYGLDLTTSKELKENFAVCSRRYADNNDSVEIEVSKDDKITINQYELSEIVEARVIELLKLAKKDINHLTNRKISYIIVTGGITELVGFSYVVENVLGINASTMNITTPGIRNNKYSSASGIIKYFYEKLKLRDLNYTMFNETKLNELMSNKKNLLNTTNETIVSKVFGYFMGD